MMMERFHNLKNKESVNIPAKSFGWWPEFRARFCMMLVAMSVLYLGALPGWAHNIKANNAIAIAADFRFCVERQ